MAVANSVFTRIAARDIDVDGWVIPAGARAILVFASVKRDESHSAEPDEFDVRPHNASTHVAFGSGVHGCVGQGLARLEAQALFAELLRRVERFEPTGEATLAHGNVIRAYKTVPVTPIPPDGALLRYRWRDPAPRRTSGGT